MSRAVAPAVREKARTRTCPDCQAAPGEKCAPDRAGRSQLHQGRIQDARRAMTPLPPFRILPPGTDQDRRFMELDPDSVDTLVVSWHQDLLPELHTSPYEATALLRLALKQAELHRPGGPPEIRNFQLGFLLAPLNFLTPGEFIEAVDRLEARGFVERVGDRGVWINPVAVRVVERRDLPARLLMKWNADRVDWAGSAAPAFPSA
ncbi:hypothetical protein OTB20_32910 [Streptomyces sp. H27-H1]|uniref:zinc finger domain-containing protein n=1 Tax=Streptomyces sp. H27-H1 TaxID=2996461 RepID=UPI002270F49F|nr:hypothetical protein [Streptomyces sp. H27-H1]MCY0930911.1 hypothetical protein [Streptomyces sp. H27-H1]